MMKLNAVMVCIVSNVDDASDDVCSIPNDDQSEDGHELRFVFPLIWSDDESENVENIFDGQANSVASDDSDSDDALKGLIWGFGNALRQLTGCQSQLSREQFH